ncbi:MAG: hypothetical protein K0Q48_3022, partial [Bacillota bacterium]|nr:hypothetical protein [Bacillota bacterium]
MHNIYERIDPYGIGNKTTFLMEAGYFEKQNDEKNENNMDDDSDRVLRHRISWDSDCWEDGAAIRIWVAVSLCVHDFLVDVSLYCYLPCLQGELGQRPKMIFSPQFLIILFW